jgi:hypothetical protein
MHIKLFLFYTHEVLLQFIFSSTGAGSSCTNQSPDWLRKMRHTADSDVYNDMPEAEKNKIIARSPSDEEMSDENHWYNRAYTDVWDDEITEFCDICGFQGHARSQCPSPRKWRLQIGGKCNK